MPIHSLACDFAARIRWEKNMEVCYFPNFKAKSNLWKCTDSPEPLRTAEMRNNMEICCFSNFEAQLSRLAWAFADRWNENIGKLGIYRIISIHIQGMFFLAFLTNPRTFLTHTNTYTSRMVPFSTLFVFTPTILFTKSGSPQRHEILNSPDMFLDIYIHISK